MEKGERSDPTFTVFVALATIFLVVFIYMTFPRHDAAAPTSPSTTDSKK